MIMPLDLLKNNGDLGKRNWVVVVGGGGMNTRKFT